MHADATPAPCARRAGPPAAASRSPRSRATAWPGRAATRPPRASRPRAARDKGIDELAAQIGPLAQDVAQLCDDGAPAAAKVGHAVHEATLAFNVVPLLGAVGEEGYTDEELKLRDESRKILSSARA